MRAKDLRKSARRQLHYPALIDLRDPPTQHNCTLWDVSESGAKIILTKDIELPKHFYMLLSLRAARVIGDDAGARTRWLAPQG